MGLFEIATRAKSKARIALTGPSGSGKTLSALYLAYGFTGDWSKIALIDTEHERGRFYAGRDDLKTGAFLYASLTPPYSAERYINYVNEASKAVGEDGVVIIDSFSHAWDNEGGVLDYKSEVAKRTGKNDFSAWDEAGKVQNNLINSILSVNCHTIITMRAKMSYAMEVNDRGKTVPVKIGLAPVQRENTEYEFDVCFQIAQNHIAGISKDTTFLDGWSGIITPELGSQLNDFLSKGVNLPRCTDCNSVITAGRTKTVQQLIEGSVKLYGRQLCIDCTRRVMNEEKAAKENAAATVSE
jgi:hypothetical protein